MSDDLQKLMADLPGMLKATGEVQGNTLTDLHPHYASMSKKLPILGLKGMTVAIGGASRGIGQGIALRCAKAGANVCVLGRSDGKVSFGPGTLSAVVEQINSLGGKGLAVACDLTKSEQVVDAVKKIVAAFTTIDVLVNNASALFPYGLEGINFKYFTVMNSVCGRGSFFLTREALPYMDGATNPHVLTIAPGPVAERTWIGPHTAYSATKINMSLQCMAWTEEFKKKGIRFNTLWPHYCVATFAVDAVMKLDLAKAVNVAHVADPAYRIVTSKVNGGYFKDLDVLTDMGIRTEPERYKYFTVNRDGSGNTLVDDFMVEPFGFNAGDELGYSPLPSSADSAMAGKKVVLIGKTPLTAEIAAKAKAAGASVEICPIIDDRLPVPKIEKEVARVSEVFGGKLDIFFADCPLPAQYPNTRGCTADYWDTNFHALVTVPYFYLQKFSPLLKEGRSDGTPLPQVLLVAPCPIPNAKLLNTGGSVPFNLLSYFRGNYVLGFGTEFCQKGSMIYKLMKQSIEAMKEGAEGHGNAALHTGQWQVNGIWAGIRQSPSADACFQVLSNTDPTNSCMFFAEDVAAMPTVTEYPKDYTKGQFVPGNYTDYSKAWLSDFSLHGSLTFLYKDTDGS